MAEKSLYNTLSEEYAASKSYRESKVEKRWEENIKLVLPEYGEFASDTEWKDARYDSIGTECLSLVAEGAFGNLCPSSSPWHRYSAVKKDLNDKSKTVPEYLEKLTEYIMNVLSTRSTFYSVGPEWFNIWGGIGTAVMDIHEDKDTQDIICAIPNPRANYVRVDGRNRVQTVYERKFWNADQAAGLFGKDKLDKVLLAALESGDTKEYEFIDCVRPRMVKNPGSPLAQDWKYGEYTWRLGADSDGFLSESGCRVFPKPTLRGSLRGNDPYGRCFIDNAMPDIRTCNQMVKDALLSWHKQADPWKLFPNEGRAWNSNPGRTDYYKDPNRLPIYPDTGKFAFDYKAWEVFQGRVRKALKVDHFLMLMQIEAQMTAREVVERKREGMSVTVSTVGRIEFEGLDPLHQRFLQIEFDSMEDGISRVERAIGPMPQELQGEGIKIEYMGPLSQQQKKVYAEQGILDALQTEAVIFTLWPEQKYKLKPSILVDRVWRAHAAPEDALKTDEEFQQTLDGMAKQAQQAQQQAMQAQAVSKVDPNAKPQQGSPAAAMMGVTG